MRIPVDEQALAAFCQRHGVRRLLFYGSVLRDDFGPSSDVDVLVEFEPGQTPTYFDLYDMERALSPLVGGRKVDLHTPGELSPYFRRTVLESAEEAYAAG